MIKYCIKIKHNKSYSWNNTLRIKIPFEILALSEYKKNYLISFK